MEPSLVVWLSKFVRFCEQLNFVTTCMSASTILKTRCYLAITHHTKVITFCNNFTLFAQKHESNNNHIRVLCNCKVTELFFNHWCRIVLGDLALHKISQLLAIKQPQDSSSLFPSNDFWCDICYLKFLVTLLKI